MRVCFSLLPVPPPSLPGSCVLLPGTEHHNPPLMGLLHSCSQWHLHIQFYCCLLLWHSIPNICSTSGLDSSGLCWVRWGDWCRLTFASAREQWGPDFAQSPGSALQEGFDRGMVLSCQVPGSQWIYLDPSWSPHTSSAPRRGKELYVPRRAEVQPCKQGWTKWGYVGGRDSLWTKGKPSLWDAETKWGQCFENPLGCSSSADSISRSPDCNFMLPITAVELITWSKSMCITWACGPWCFEHLCIKIAIILVNSHCSSSIAHL